MIRCYVQESAAIYGVLHTDAVTSRDPTPIAWFSPPSILSSRSSESLDANHCGCSGLPCIIRIRAVFHRPTISEPKLAS